MRFGMYGEQRVGKGKRNGPVSQICALIVFESTTMLRVANSTPMVDLDSILNSFRVNRESTTIKTSSWSVANPSARLTVMYYHRMGHSQFLWREIRPQLFSMGRLNLFCSRCGRWLTIFRHQSLRSTPLSTIERLPISGQLCGGADERCRLSNEGVWRLTKRKS